VATTDTLYVARFELAAELLDQGRDNLLKCRVYRSGALVAPTAGASSVLTVKDPNGTAVVNAAAVTVAASVAQYNVTAAALASYSTPSEGWLVEWSLLMADNVVHTFATQAMLVRRPLYPVVTEADLYRRCALLNPASAAPLTSQTDFTDKLDEAFVLIQNRLIEAGNRPWLTISPGSLREAHALLTLKLIFEDLASRLNEAHEARAVSYGNQFEDAWRRLKLVYERSDGMPDTSSARGASPGMIWTNLRG
jgi:hypothetical protein